MRELAKTEEVITFLDSTRSIVKKTDKGFIKAVSHKVELSKEKGHIWELKGEWMLTAEGYERINQYVGLKQVKEDKIVLNGEEFTNPYIKYDKYGRKVAGLQKCTLAGYDPSGKLQMSSVIITYNSVEEFTARVMKSAMWTKDGETEFARLTPRFTWDALSKELPTYVPYDIDDVMILAVNTANKGFMKLYQELEEKRGNLEKKLQTVARRNAFRKHPATGGMYKVRALTKCDVNNKPVDTVAYVNVIQWVDINEQSEEEQINQWLLTDNFEVDKYHEQDPTDNDDEYIPEEDVEESEIDLEVVAEISEKEDDEEKDTLIAWITKGSKRTGYKLSASWEELSIMELEAIREDIIKLEDEA